MSAGAVALLLSGCTSDLGWLLRFSGDSPIEVRELARSMQCGTQEEQSAVTVFTDANEFRKWQEQRGVKLIDSDAMPAGPYALVEMGRRATAGFGVAISRKAGMRRDLVVLKGTFISPAADAISPQVITSPCVLMGLPSRFYRGVVVFNQAGEIQATSLSKE
ncbi:MAG: protease complex subunit PrcB family protein [Pseudomonadota bacterium]